MVCRGPHQTLPIAVDPDGFDVPVGLVARGQTAFLALRASITWLGRWVDPYIEVFHGTQRVRQYFERGAVGQRHLNISPIFQESGGRLVGRVGLFGRAIRWKRDAALIVYDSPPVTNAQVLVLAPHPDDAEISAFGMYSGRPSWVATITAGEGGMADLSAVVPAKSNTIRWNAQLRVWDSLTVPRLGSVPPQRCLNLVYPDGQLGALYRRAPPVAMLACEESLPRATLRLENSAPEFRTGQPACTWDGLVEELRRLLEMARPDIVICPHPLVDAHHDHVFTTVALDQALREGAFRSSLFFLYTVHRRGAPLHPFGPRTAIVTFPPWTDPEWIADSIYSHPLEPQVQLGKYFAVEAMHDARTFTTAEPRPWRQVLMDILRALSAWFAGTGLPPASHLRRAPRPNEIYGVVSAQSLSELVERALARDSAARD